MPAEGRNSPANVLESESGSLFVDGALLHLSEFEINETNSVAVAAILRRVDGIPLCLEMAAAHVGYLSPTEIAIRLADRFELLEADDTGGPARHRTMRETIAWPYDTLQVDGRRLFQRLAIFVGGFSIEAAEAVAGRSPGAVPCYVCFGR